MNLGKKLGYWRMHTRSITEHRDEPLSLRKAMIEQMRADLDRFEAEMEQFEQHRFAELMKDAEDPVAVAAKQVAALPEAPTPEVVVPAKTGKSK